MIKNYNFPIGKDRIELYVGGSCVEAGRHHIDIDCTVAYLIPLKDGRWKLRVSGCGWCCWFAVSTHKTYLSAKRALGKIRVSSCFERDGIRGYDAPNGMTTDELRNRLLGTDK